MRHGKARDRARNGRGQIALPGQFGFLALIIEKEGQHRRFWRNGAEVKHDLRARFGVIPQIMPVLLAQVLYYLESNTRSATVIGAIVGGGIGLLLTQAIITQKDWEEVAYYMVLIVLMVMLMDSLSGWLRRKLIKGS